MKVYYFRDSNNNKFSVQGNNAREATKLANDIAAKNTNERGFFGMAFFSGTVVDDDEIYHKGFYRRIN